MLFLFKLSSVSCKNHLLLGKETQVLSGPRSCDVTGGPHPVIYLNP